MLLPRKHKCPTDNNNHGATLGASGLQERRKGRPGRPMKRPEELKKPRRAILQEQRIIHEQAQQDVEQSPALSPFEQLPTELIQHIFFDTLEPNLAMTCTRMNQALSSETVFRSLLLLAYYQPHNYEGDISNVDEKVFLPARYRYLCHNERLDLQRVITGYRWCNLARISAVVPILSKLAARASFERVLRDFPALGSGDTPSYLPDADDIDGIQKRYSAWQSSPFYQVIEEIQGWRFSPQSGNDDAMPFLHVPVPIDKLDELYAMRLPPWPTAILCPVLGVLSIPEKVLRGNPWTTEKLAMLRLLRQGLRAEELHRHKTSVHEPSDFFVSATDLFEGMACAIRERNRTALLTLLELYRDLITPPARSMIAQYGASQLSYWEENESKNTVCRLPVTLFHLATKADQWSAELLWLLAMADTNSVPLDDDVLTAWALRAASGSKFAGWLLHWMEKAVEMEHAEKELVMRPPGRAWLSEHMAPEEQAYGKDVFSCFDLHQAVG